LDPVAAASRTLSDGLIARLDRRTPVVMTAGFWPEFSMRIESAFIGKSDPDAVLDCSKG